MRISKDDVYAVFEKQLEYHPHEKLSEKKAKLIRQRFRDGYSIPEMVKAIVGCHNTPHNLGQNDRQTKYLGLHVSLKSENIDRFIEVGDSVVAEKTRDRTEEEQRKARERQEYLDRKNLNILEREAELAAFRAERKAAGL